jgi:hypothetical protein
MADTQLVVDYPPLVRHREELRTQRRARRIRLAVAVPVALGLVALAASASPPLATLLAGLSAVVIFFIALPGASSVDAGMLAGVEGEAAVLERLRRLPDDYTVLNRVRLPDETLANGERELDFIVAGPTGLWVVEVKNTPGHVRVTPGEKHWPLARRAGCGSRPQWNAMPNPVPQVRAQVDALERWLLRQGVVASAGGVIVMAHPEVAVEDGTEAEMPVLVRDQVDAYLKDASAAPVQADATRLLADLR